MINEKQLEEIKERFVNLVLDENLSPILCKDMCVLIATVKHQRMAIERLSETAGKLNEYLQGKVEGEWGNNVADVAVRYIEEQNKKIERYEKILEEEGYILL